MFFDWSRVSTILELTLGLLVAASWVYWIVAWRAVVGFVRGRVAEADRFLPAVSILKPIKGMDAEAIENFASFCVQDYPRFEILFGVAEPTDPAVAAVKSLKKRFPEVPIDLVIAPAIGQNPKCSILHKLCLRARNPILVISDSDIRVGPDYLRSVVAPLADEKTGLVTCLYRSEYAANIPARLTALGLNVDFIPSVIVASRLLGFSVGIGATLAVRRRDLVAIGGYADIADFLADDYQVATRIVDRGLKVHLSHYLVTNVLGPTAVRAQWQREIRWARNIRSLQPVAYFGIPITYTLPLSLLLMLVGGLTPGVLAMVAVSLSLRCILPRRLLSLLECKTRPGYLILQPTRDLLTAIVWLCGAWGRSIVWRGAHYTIVADNRLAPSDQRPPLRRRLATAFVIRLDRTLRRWQKIYEFTRDPDCLLRLSVHESPRRVEFQDGSRIDRGEVVGELHLWNEHLASIARESSSLRQASRYRRSWLRSVRDLAHHVEHQPELASVRAYYAVLPPRTGGHARSANRIAKWLGAEVRAIPPSSRWRDRLHALGDDILVQMLTSTFNPGRAHARRTTARQEIWISTPALLARFGTRGRKMRSRSEASHRRRVPRTKRPEPRRIVRDGFHSRRKTNGSLDPSNRLGSPGGMVDLPSGHPVPQLPNRRAGRTAKRGRRGHGADGHDHHPGA